MKHISNLITISVGVAIGVIVGLWAFAELMWYLTGPSGLR